MSETNNGETVSYEYDNVGNLTKMILPSGKQIIKNYDPLSRVTGILNENTPLVQYTYNGIQKTKVFTLLQLHNCKLRHHVCHATTCDENLTFLRLLVQPKQTNLTKELI